MIVRGDIKVITGSPGLDETSTSWFRSKNVTNTTTPKHWHLFIQSLFLEQYFSFSHVGFQHSTYKKYLINYKTFIANTKPRIINQSKDDLEKLRDKLAASLLFGNETLVLISKASGHLFVDGDMHTEMYNMIDSISKCAHAKEESIQNSNCQNKSQKCRTVLHLDDRVAEKLQPASQCKTYSFCDGEQSGFHGPLKFTWIYNLDAKLALNLTFLVLQFQSGPVNFYGGNLPCNVGNLTVETFKNNSDVLIFCGQHSGFSIYPGFSDIALTVSAMNTTRFSIDYIFMVQDRDLSVTRQVRANPAKIPFLFYMLPVNKTVFQLLVQVKKMFKMCLKLKGPVILLHIFNGPGCLADEVFPKNKIFFMSGFQGFIQGILADQGTGMTKLNIHSRLVQLKVLELTEAVVLDLPDTKLCFTHCILEVGFDNESKINVTPTSLQYKGIPSDSCAYGGFTTAEIRTRHCSSTHAECVSFEENIILCGNHDGSKEMSRHFYGSHQSLLVILYWFPNYTTINMSLSIQPTNCSSIQICLCSMHEAKAYMQTYLKDRPDYTDDGVVKLWETDHFGVMVQQAVCVTLQIVRKQVCAIWKVFRIFLVLQQSYLYTSHLDLYCKVDRQHPLYHIQTKGKLDQTEPSQQTWIPCFYKCLLVNQVCLRTFQGHTERYTNQTRSLKIQPVSYIQDKQTPQLFAYNYDFIKVDAEFPIKIPFLEVTEPFNAQNWIEIFITRNYKFTTNTNQRHFISASQVRKVTLPATRRSSWNMGRSLAK